MYDLETAKANIATEIQTTRTRLTELEQQQQMIDTHGPSVLLLVTTLQKYGKTKPPKDTVPLDASSDRGLVEALVLAADTPLRAKDVIARSHGKLKVRAVVGSALTQLCAQGRLKRMGHGLYWRIGETATPSSNGTKPHAKPMSARATAVALQTHIESWLQSHPGKHGWGDLLQATADFPFRKRGATERKGTIARVLARSPHIKKTGHARGVAYAYKG